jgi:hypothetical protein
VKYRLRRWQGNRRQGRSQGAGHDTNVRDKDGRQRYY